MAQWLIEGLTATISGVMTVFVVLMLIAFLIGKLKYIDKLKFLKKEVIRNTITANSVVAESVKVKSKEDLELIAVITAAVAASMSTSTDQLIVKSIRRVENNRRRL